MVLKIGDKAPAFSLYNSEKEKVSLSDFEEKNVIILFFPLAFTSTCTKELCIMRDRMDMYNSLNAQVLGISVDSLYSLNKFREEQNLNFPLLSDFNKEVSRAYGSLAESFAFDMRGVSKRSAFVVDGQGKIRYQEVLDIPSDLPNFNQINKTLQELS